MAKIPSWKSGSSSSSIKSFRIDDLLSQKQNKQSEDTSKNSLEPNYKESCQISSTVSSHSMSKKNNSPEEDDDNNRIPFPSYDFLRGNKNNGDLDTSEKLSIFQAIPPLLAAGYAAAGRRFYRDTQSLEQTCYNDLLNSVQIPPFPAPAHRHGHVPMVLSSSFRRSSSSGFPHQAILSANEIPSAFVHPGMYASFPWDNHPNNGFPFTTFYHHHSSGNKRKGGQIRFTNFQTSQLETSFLDHKYLNANDRKKLAGLLGLSDRQVKTWFQNRRAKWRKTKEAHKNGMVDNHIMSMDRDEQHEQSSPSPEDHDREYDSPLSTSHDISL